MPINKDRVQKLVDALRSGDYKQTRGVLKRKDAYCCLGVACDVYRKETGEGKWEESTMFPGEGRFLDSNGDLPQAVADWFGFSCTNPALPISSTDFFGYHTETVATLCNDSLGLTLPEIADGFEGLIKENHENGKD